MTAKEYTRSAPLWADAAMQLALRVCGCKADAEDAVQEALASLWQRRENVAYAKGRGYLLSSTYRQLMSQFRHQAVHRCHLSEVDAGAAHVVMPDERFDVREAVERSLQVLPEVQRAILQLRDVENYSYAEIGETLHLNADQVQVYLFRARVAMRKQMILLGYGNNQ